MSQYKSAIRNSTSQKQSGASQGSEGLKYGAQTRQLRELFPDWTDEGALMNGYMYRVHRS